MIGEVTTSGSFAGALAYAMRNKPEDKKLSKEELEKKFPEVAPTADDPGWKASARHRVIGGNMSGETELELNCEFARVRNLRPDIKSPVLSISTRKAPADSVRLQEWGEIAAQELEAVGLKDCPFLIIQHRDKDDHIHIIASRIRLDGKVISDSKSYERVERVMREVEIKYGFERVPESRQTPDRSPTWWEHKVAHEKGKLSPKMEMQARISIALEDQPTTTQFINRLREAHGIEPIFRLNEDGAPCGITFRYGDTVMSGGALGRGYTWKKLQERGLTYDERDLEAIKRTSERAGQGRQSIADQERTIDRAARTIGDAGRNTVNDRPSGGAVREATTEYDEREVQGQQHAARSDITRGDQQPDQTSLPEAEANSVSTSGKSPTTKYGSVGDETPLDALTPPPLDPFFINVNPNIPGPANIGLFSTQGMAQPTAIAGSNQEIKLVGTIGFNGAADTSVGDDLISPAGNQCLDNLSATDPASLTNSFRDGIREAILDANAYMQEYWQEDAQYQAAMTVEPIASSELTAEVDMEAEEIIALILEL